MCGVRAVAAVGAAAAASGALQQEAPQVDDDDDDRHPGGDLDDRSQVGSHQHQHDHRDDQPADRIFEEPFHGSPFSVRRSPDEILMTTL